ncbi:MBG domain-containing protein [Cohnella mopanensis]|uniref:MBG domain-containing protein n=1 Tax=Cohnella mopanensis TaxID=2911966 RepID=UPI001EF778B0|nr:MBG domain-containing protein [Cohnella mopanensis]
MSMKRTLPWIFGRQNIIFFFLRLVILIAGMVAFQSVQTAWAQETLDQANDGNSNAGTAATLAGQSFTAGMSGWLHNIELQLYLNSESQQRPKAEILEGEGMHGRVLATADIPYSSGNSGWQRITFVEGVQIQAGNKYTIRLKGNDQGGYVALNWSAISNNPYVAGVHYISDFILDYDTIFRTYVSNERLDYKSSNLTLNVSPARYGQQTSLSASLTSNGQPLANFSVTFWLNGDSVGTAVTDQSGIAKLAYTVDKRPGNYTLNATSSAQNNVVSATNVATLSILKGELTVSADDANREYGASDPVFTASFSGLAPNDLPGRLGNLWFTTNSTIGSPVGIYSLEVSGLSTTDYDVSYESAKLRITKAPLIVTPTDVSREYGATNPGLTGTVSGVKNSDNLPIVYTTTAATYSNVGQYPISATLGDPDNKLGNYNATFNQGALNVTAKPLIVTPDSYFRWTGDPNPELSGTVTGLVGDDEIESAFLVTADELSEPGDYPITVEWNDPLNRLPNYNVIQNGGILRVYHAPLILFGSGEDADRVTQDLTLPDKDSEGFDIDWSSTNDRIVDPRNGKVVPPTYDTGDMEVVLKAAVSRYGREDSRSFRLKVLASALTDKESVERARDALEIQYGGDDRADSVTLPLGLNDPALFETRTTWTSSRPDVIDPATGKVVRPSYPSGNARVLLEAHITKGTELAIQTFDLTVLRLPLVQQPGSGSGGGSSLSGNATLKSLDLRVGKQVLELNPKFSADVVTYTAETKVGQIAIAVSVDHAGAEVTMRMNGRSLSNAETTDLNVGDNRLEITVKSENGTKKTYTVLLHYVPEVKEVPELPKEPTEELLPFADITGHWAELQIRQAVARKYVSGYSDGTFKPNGAVTRAEFVVMLMNALKPNRSDTELNFTDQHEIQTWSRSAIAMAVQEGIVQGYPDGSFGPNESINRAEMTKIIANALKLPTNLSSTDFSDNSDIPQWAIGAVNVLHSNNIIKGRAGNLFAPHEPLTRAEAVILIMRLTD